MNSEQKASSLNGVINVYKEKGFTSFDVVAKLKGILKTRKIGHTGTLDPDAEGVLPICVGNATKLCELFIQKDKVYETVLLLGTVTDTQDSSGTILKQSKVSVTKEEAEKVIHTFVGSYEQIPPMYSALKVNGKKLYELARKGITVERKPRPVTIYEIKIIQMNILEDNTVSEISMRVCCSKGTYIRTLCQDIGEALGCGGCMKQLLRVKTGSFELRESLKLAEIERYVQLGKIKDILIPADSFLSYPTWKVQKQQEHLLLNGNPLKKDEIEIYQTIQQLSETQQSNDNKISEFNQIKLYTSDGVFAGIYEWKPEKNSYYPVKMFL